jgi:hypothetical protein
LNEQPRFFLKGEQPRFLHHLLQNISCLNITDLTVGLKPPKQPLETSLKDEGGRRKKSRGERGDEEEEGLDEGEG